MNTNRPDIAKAVGMFIGAVVCFFIFKFILIFFSLLIMLVAAIKNI